MSPAPLAAVGTRTTLLRVEAAASVPDGDGEYHEVWTPLDPAEWWARVQPAPAQDIERIGSSTVISTLTHIVVGPYHPQLTTRCRLIAEARPLGAPPGPRVFLVTGISNPDEAGIETVAYAAEQT